MIRTIAEPWLSQNAGRRYPLADDSSGMDGTDGGRTVNRDNAILDFRCTVRVPGLAGAPVASVGLVRDTESVRVIEVDITCCGDALDTLSFEIPRFLAGSESHHTFASVSAKSIGTITVTAAVLTVEARRFDVPFAASTVVADCLGVDSVTGLHGVSYDGDDQHHIDGPGAVLAPDDGEPVEIVLDAGANADPYLDGNRIRLEISKGYGRGEWCQRQEATQNCGNVLFSINGERPGSDGDIRLVGGGGVVIKPDPGNHALVITVDRPSADMLARDCRTSC